MVRNFGWVLLAIFLSVQAGYAQQVSYEFRLRDMAHHEAAITVTWTGLPAGQTLEARMSRSSPGRYAIHEFAKNVYSVAALDSKGTRLPITRPDPYQWNIAGHDGTVRLTYTLFCDRADGTYSQIDRTHAHLNGPATWMWAKGTDNWPVTISFLELPPDWRIATQLFPTTNPTKFSAPGLQYLMDSPVMAANLELHSWTVTEGAKTQTIRLALHHDGTAEAAKEYVELLKKVVMEQAGVLGGLPAFDGGVYTFLACYLPHASGDGMEHRNSTIITSSGSLAANRSGLLGTASHEFFHAWNVERIRPKSLEPFDFTGANMSAELWLAEGFTSYYGPLAIRTAGITDDRAFAAGLSGAVNTVSNAPGRNFFSPVEMSLQAPFVDAATSIDPHNRVNTFISYYTWGTGIALALDLELRSGYGRSLDDFFRAMWQRHGLTERPYQVADAEEVLAEVSGDRVFANDFFAKYVTGKETPDYPRLLALAGLAVQPAEPGKAWWGDLSWRKETGGLRLLNNTTLGSPAYQVGIDRGDLLIEIAGSSVVDESAIAALLDNHKPGDSLAVVFESRGNRVHGMVRLAENPRVRVVTLEELGKMPSPQQSEFRGKWLASRAASR